MNIFEIKFLYLYWHYTKAIKDYFDFFKTMIWFVWHFFSIPNLIRTFFSPFKRLQENYKGGLNIEDFFASIAVTTMMRVVGMFLRTIVIILGLVSLLFVFLIGILGFFVWILMPLFLAVLIIFGLIKIFKI